MIEGKGSIRPRLRGLTPADRIHYDTVVLRPAQLSLSGNQMEFRRKNPKDNFLAYCPWNENERR